MADFTFATLRLGKTSVEDIKRINSKESGTSTAPFPISVVCTQVPTDLAKGTYVFIWLGSDNSKGMPTEWKQGFKALGRITNVSKGEKYNDESTTNVEILYIFPEAVGRIDLLRDAAHDYYYCATMPLIGLDDHSNQTIRKIDVGTLSHVESLFAALQCVSPSFEKDITSLVPEFKEIFERYRADETLSGACEGSKKHEKVHREQNRIFFGAPGTGKSHELNQEKDELLADGGYFERVTFHPDYAYANFVGTYKPVPCKDKDGNEAITYSYVPGPFIRCYIKALRSLRSENPQPSLLIIEEINRANVAAVFGDVFQLLDRNESGESEYPIQASEDVRNYLAKELDGKEGIPDHYKEIKIPDNMYIWATMNSADQGVYPMDTAFKRRWDFSYLGVDEKDSGIAGRYVVLGEGEYSRRVEWNELRKAINEQLLSNKVNEDKLMGPYFLSKKCLPEKETDSAEFIRVFKNKVIMYLFDDAAKMKKDTLFAGCESSARNQYSKICAEFDQKGVFIFSTTISGQFNEMVKTEDEPR